MALITDDLTSTDQHRAIMDARLLERMPRVALYSNYYDGNHRLQFATSKFREAFGELFEAFATNWCGLVIDVAVDRLKVQGFRFDAEEADEDALAIWQANRLDAQSVQAHTEAVKCETAYLLVSPPLEGEEMPRITVEHPAQCFVLHDPADRTKRLAGYKRYQDKNGNHIAVVYEPERITTYTRKASVENLESLGWVFPTGTTTDWDAVSSVPNLLGVVPLVPLENAPNLLTGGTSDLKPAVKLNDAANKFFTDMIHASEFTSFPQRILTGVEIPRDPITGEVLDEEQVKAAVSRLWVFEGDNAKAHQLAVGDLGNYVEGVDMAIQHLAAQTRTPPHYLLAKLANISGEALITAEVGLVARCRRKFLDFSDSWEEAMRLSFLWRAIRREATGDKAGAGEDRRRAEMFDAETIWEDPERINPSTMGDSLIKKQSIGVPWEALMEEAGYTPQQIVRMREQRAAEKAEAVEEERAKQQMSMDFEVQKAKALPKPAPVAAPRR